MKNKNQLILAIASLSLIVLISACKKDDNTSTAKGEDQSGVSALRTSNASLVFPPQAHMSGKTYGEWGAEWWKWTLGFDCATSPHANSTGSYQDQNQSGPVYFLAGAYFNTPAFRTAHVSADKMIFFSLLARLDDDSTGLQ